MSIVKNQSEKHPYPSRFGAGFVSVSQYITEIFCEHVARQKHKDLPNKFWELTEWKKFYANQIPSVCKLLKKYPAHVILAAIRDKRSYNIYSIRSPYLLKIIDKYNAQNRNSNIEEESSVTPQVEDTTSPIPFQDQKTGKSSLYKLDF